MIDCHYNIIFLKAWGVYLWWCPHSRNTLKCGAVCFTVFGSLFFLTYWTFELDWNNGGRGFANLPPPFIPPVSWSIFPLQNGDISPCLYPPHGKKNHKHFSMPHKTLRCSTPYVREIVKLQHNFISESFIYHFAQFGLLVKHSIKLKQTAHSDSDNCCLSYYISSS